METSNKIILIFSILFLIVIVLFFVSMLSRRDLMGWAKVPNGSTGNEACPSGYKCMFVVLDVSETDSPSTVPGEEIEFPLAGCAKTLVDGDDWTFCVKK